MNLGIIGMGFVGGTTSRVLGEVHEIFPYDKYKAPYTGEQRMRDIASKAEVAFLCVPTPMNLNGSINLQPMYDSLELLTKTARETSRVEQDILVTVRSTAVSGTTDSFAKIYPHFRFAFNPEFLREKRAFEDMANTRVVTLGVEDERSRDQLTQLYKARFPDAQIKVYDRKTAEMIKYARNVALASQVMVFNEIWRICKALGVDYKDIKESMAEDPRIGSNTQVPGQDGEFGFGGKCLPKDLCAFIHLARENHIEPHVLAEVWRSNLDVRERHDWEEIPGAVSQNQNFSST